MEKQTGNCGQIFTGCPVVDPLQEINDKCDNIIDFMQSRYFSWQEKVNEECSMMLTPVGKRLLIKPVEVKQGSLLITNQKPTQFTVIAIGDEVTKVEAGNVIYLEKHYGVEIDYESDKFLVIDESSILAKIE
jgi:co-chaperonin GroES (HSP10)